MDEVGSAGWLEPEALRLICRTRLRTPSVPKLPCKQRGSGPSFLVRRCCRASFYFSDGRIAQVHRSRGARLPSSRSRQHGSCGQTTAERIFPWMWFSHLKLVMHVPNNRGGPNRLLSDARSVGLAILYAPPCDGRDHDQSECRRRGRAR
jgi:hypothetical protein